jgi:hypothetical protein
MNYIMGLDIVMGCEIIKTAYEKKAEEQLWSQYALQYPGMDETTFITFEDYKIKAFGNKTVLDKEEILKDAEEARRLVEEGR